MCGFVCLIRKTRDVDASELRGLCDTLTHRGPDGGGQWLHGQLGLGHRRLSILDLSEQGAQPMHRGHASIVYNGEIYNYLELKQELGGTYSTGTDTEVLLQTYLRHGAGLESRLNGMWGFALFDHRRNTLVLSRDRFGIKPVYYYEDREIFVAASEIRAILPLVDRFAVNDRVVIDYLVTCIVDHDDETFFRGIRKLPGGHRLEYDLASHEHRVSRYHDLRESRDRIADAAEYQALLEDAVRIRMRSDVRVGTCLSGGLDSSAVTCLATRHHRGREPFRAIHVRSVEERFDESVHARAVADRTGSDLSITLPGAEAFGDAVETLVRIQEYPFVTPSMYMQYFVMAEAAAREIKVLLDGQGGDETLLGYGKYAPVILNDIRRREGAGAALRFFAGSLRHSAGWNPLTLAKYYGGMNFAALRKRGHWHEAFFVKKEYRTQDFPFLDALAKDGDDLFDLQVREIESMVLPSLLRYEDKSSMHFSIETRLPFLDYRVVEAALNLPLESKMHAGWSKYVLRNLLDAELDDAVVWRRDKLGFAAPTDTWLRASEARMRADVLGSEFLASYCELPLIRAGWARIGPRLRWRLWNLALWARTLEPRMDRGAA